MMLAPEPQASELITAKSGVTMVDCVGKSGARSVELQASRPAAQAVELSLTVQVPGMPPAKSSDSRLVMVGS
jgi:hypothetical protein